MAGIIKTSINLAKIPKDKIIDGAKGKYLPITITVNDDVDQFEDETPLPAHALLRFGSAFPRPPRSHTWLTSRNSPPREARRACHGTVRLVPLDARAAAAA